MRVIYDAIRRESGFESIVKSGCSLTVVVLTLLGLAEVGPPAFFVAIATIVFGVRLSLDPVLARDSVSGGSVGAASGGCPTVLHAGVAGILLGTLALLGASSIQLAALAAIAFGRSIMISSNGGLRMRAWTARCDDVQLRDGRPRRTERPLRKTSGYSAGVAEMASAGILTGSARRRKRRQAIRTSRNSLTQAFGSTKCAANSLLVSRGRQYSCLHVLNIEWSSSACSGLTDRAAQPQSASIVTRPFRSNWKRWRLGTWLSQP